MFILVGGGALDAPLCEESVPPGHCDGDLGPVAIRPPLVIARERSDRGNPYFKTEVMKSMQYYVYILANATRTTLYIGVTQNLLRRVYEHKQNLDPGSFTAKYGVHALVYYEVTTDVRAAIEREKQLKGWNRARKNKLVMTMNPKWEDLYPGLLG